MSFTLQKPVVYIVRDIERALGLPINTKGYYIISNSTPFANSLVKGRKNVLLIKNKELLDTRELMVDVRVKRFVNKIKNAQILVFKNTLAIEKNCQENNWPLLNPNAALAAKVEEKITQVEWLGELKKFLPSFEIKISREIKWTGEKFILQFNRAHTGSGTILVENETQLKEIQTKFPDREVRVTKFVDGSMLTNNNVVCGKKVLCGNINYQITGLKPFSNLPFATIGNDWALPNKLLNSKQKQAYFDMAQAVGTKLAQDGWRGLFGVDVMLEKNTGKLYLIEINARQPASTTFESQLQFKKNKTGLNTFQAHILALLSEKCGGKLITIKDGAQITQKIIPVKKQIELKKLLSNIKKFNQSGFGVVLYNNSKPESDWIRMQSPKGVMETTDRLNSVGQDMLFFSMGNLGARTWAQKRAAAIIVKEGKILLMERMRYGQQFYIVPGGTVEDGECLFSALKREIKEETGLNIQVSKEKPVMYQAGARKEYHYFVKSFSGEPKLGGEEKENNSQDNNYQLVWKDLNDLKNLEFYPVGLKKEIYKKYKK